MGRIFQASCALLAAILISGWAPGQPARAATTPEQAAGLGAEAYRYGFPLLESVRVRTTLSEFSCLGIPGTAPVNTFGHVLAPIPLQSLVVVAPNLDTMYSVAHLDLGDGPVVLSHPDMGDRYFVFQLLDPFTEIAGYIGSRTTGGGAGRFAIAWTGAPGTQPPGTRTITVPHRRIWVLGRTSSSDDPAEQRAAAALVGQYTLTAPGGAAPRRACRWAKVPEIVTPSGLPFLSRLNAALRDNPPPAADAPLLRRLAAIGVGPGRRLAAGLSPQAVRALDAGVRRYAKVLPRESDAYFRDAAAANAGWAFGGPRRDGYGTDYRLRAIIAYAGLGANLPDEALYAFAPYDEQMRELDGRYSYRLRFAPGQEPPARAFWSLTSYDSRGRLAGGPKSRPVVGTNHPPLLRRPDGSIEVAISNRRPADPGVNWLQTPPGRFKIALRVYVPDDSLIDGTWRPPGITRDGG